MRKIYSFIIASLLFSASAYAQPANDNCTGAIAITVGGGCTSGGSNVGATASTTATPTCWGSKSHDVWYSFVASDDSMTISTDYYGDGSGDLTDTEIAVYSGACGSITQVGCDGDGGVNVAFNSLLNLTTLTVGATYFVRVDGYSTLTGDFCLTAYETPAPETPEGYNCANATQTYPSNVCSKDDGSLTYNYTGDWTNTVGADYCGCDTETSQKGAWIKFTANSTSTTLSDQTSGANQTTHDYTVFTGSCSSLTCVSCTSVAKGGTTSISTTVGTTYYVLITPQGSSTSNQRTDICVTGAACTAPTNDECGNATAINANTTYTATLACATPDKANCSGSTENNIWFTWTAPSTWTAGQQAFLNLWGQNCASGDLAGGVQLSVFNSSEACGSITGGSSECDALVDQNNSSDINVGFPADPNTTYYISMDGEAGDACTFNFAISATVLAPLPVDLAYFGVKKAGKTASLSWITTNERNSDYFDVERSKDGVNFEFLTRVEAQTNSVAVNYYDIVDDKPFMGVSYYRLKQMDMDGKFIYTEIKAINFSPSDIFSVRPNPANSIIDLSFEALKDENTPVIVFDYSGRLVSKQIFNSVKGFNSFKLDVSTLPSGMYFITVPVDGEIQKVKLVKE